MAGPGIVGIIAAIVAQSIDLSFWATVGMQAHDAPLKVGLLVAAVFPIISVVGVMWLNAYGKRVGKL